MTGNSTGPTVPTSPQRPDSLGEMCEVNVSGQITWPCIPAATYNGRYESIIGGTQHSEKIPRSEDFQRWQETLSWNHRVDENVRTMLKKRVNCVLYGKRFTVTERFSEGQPWTQTSWQRWSSVFKFRQLSLILLLEMCFKVLTTEIKIGKAIETLDWKNQPQRGCQLWNIWSVSSENIISDL